MHSRPLMGGTAGVVAASLVWACSSFSSAGTPSGGPDGSAADGEVVQPPACGAAICPPAPSCEAGASCDAGLPACDAGAGTRACHDRYIFLTAGTLPGDFAADGGSAIELADRFCASEAARQTSHHDLEGRPWRAWICVDGDQASGRAGTTDARWIDPEGRILFGSLEELHVSAPRTKIGDTQPWTGCAPYGAPAVGATCADWTSSLAFGNVGQASATDQSWSGYASRPCTNAASIYCFEATP